MFKIFKTIDKPQLFYSYVHKPLNVKEHRFDKDEPLSDSPNPNDKSWRILFSYHELKKFFHAKQ
jgi:hypothetical protein